MADHGFVLRAQEPRVCLDLGGILESLTQETHIVMRAGRRIAGPFWGATPGPVKVA
jgi:hypothetical protein